MRLVVEALYVKALVRRYQSWSETVDAFVRAESGWLSCRGVVFLEAWVVEGHAILMVGCRLNLLPVSDLAQSLVGGRGRTVRSTVPTMRIDATQEVIRRRWSKIGLHDCIRVFLLRYGRYYLFHLIAFVQLHARQFTFTEGIVIILKRAFIAHIDKELSIAQLALSSRTLFPKVLIMQGIFQWLIDKLRRAQASWYFCWLPPTCGTALTCFVSGWSWIIIAAEIVAHGWYHRLSEWFELNQLAQLDYILCMLLMVGVLDARLSKVNLFHH